MPKANASDEVILEFVQVGALVRVSAMEPNTLTEVVIYGPASAAEADLRRLALRKLDYVLRRAAGGQSQSCLSKPEPCSRACQFRTSWETEPHRERPNRCCTSCSN